MEKMETSKLNEKVVNELPETSRMGDVVAAMNPVVPVSGSPVEFCEESPLVPVEESAVVEPAVVVDPVVMGEPVVD